MSDTSPLPGVLGDRYSVERKLARGGMADIFLAEDQVLERSVVIKMLLPQYAGDPAFVERFRREAKSAAKLNHTNVVSVYDWGKHDDTYFMAMEYVEGRSLAEVLAEQGRLSVARAIEVTDEAAAGLGFAHERGMVHRDVKPGNIMITETGQVKVADFGIARALDGDDSLTQTGNVMGTAAYFSPEQARGEEVDPRSDLYSLGVVFFEMVAGERPFSGTSPLSVAYKHVGEAPPAPSSLNADLPPAVDEFVATMLAKDPDHRYADADQVRAVLGRIAAGAPTHDLAPDIPAASPESMPTAMDGAVTQAHLGPDVATMPGGAPVGATNAMPAAAGGGGRPVGGGRPPAERSGGSGVIIFALAALLVAAVVLIFIIGSSLTDPSTSTDGSTDDGTETSVEGEDGESEDDGSEDDGEDEDPPASPTTEGSSDESESETSSPDSSGQPSDDPTTTGSSPGSTTESTSSSTSASTTSTSEAATTTEEVTTTEEETTTTEEETTTTEEETTTTEEETTTESQAAGAVADDEIGDEGADDGEALP